MPMRYPRYKLLSLSKASFPFEAKTLSIQPKNKMIYSLYLLLINFLYSYNFGRL